MLISVLKLKDKHLLICELMCKPVTKWKKNLHFLANVIMLLLMQWRIFENRNIKKCSHFSTVLEYIYLVTI